MKLPQYSAMHIHINGEPIAFIRRELYFEAIAQRDKAALELASLREWVKLRRFKLKDPSAKKPRKKKR